MWHLWVGKKNWSLPVGVESIILCWPVQMFYYPRLVGAETIIKQAISKFPRPLYQNEVKCSAFDMEMIFHSHANKTHFHKKSCALGTRKWPWLVMQLVIHSHTLLLRETQKLSVLSFHWNGYPLRYSWNVLTKLFFFNAGGLDVGDFAIKLARVNCFDWNDVCEKNNITIYPTIKMFRWVFFKNELKSLSLKSIPYSVKTFGGSFPLKQWLKIRTNKSDSQILTRITGRVSVWLRWGCSSFRLGVYMQIFVSFRVFRTDSRYFLPMQISLSGVWREW